MDDRSVGNAEAAKPGMGDLDQAVQEWENEGGAVLAAHAEEETKAARSSPDGVR